MTETDMVGWVAAVATLLTFSMRAMIPLRVTALLPTYASSSMARCPG